MIEALEQIPYIKRKLSSINETENKMPASLLITFKELFEKQKELNYKLFKLHEKLLEATTKVQTQSSVTETSSSVVTRQFF